jgi:hypothetical protein
MKTNNILDISLEYALSQFDEITLDNIITSELSQEDKIEAIMKLDNGQKIIILIKMGFKKEFLKTI